MPGKKYSDKQVFQKLLDAYETNTVLSETDTAFIKAVVRLKGIGLINESVKALGHNMAVTKIQYFGKNYPLSTAGESINRKNWYQRLQEKTWFLILRDLFALAGAVLSIIALIRTVFGT